MAGPRKLVSYIKQFLDPKFNPDRRGALQMLAAAPLAPKLKALQSVAGPTLDPKQFYANMLNAVASETGNDLPEVVQSLYRDMWDEARNVGKAGEYAVDSAYDNLYESGHLDDWLTENPDTPFLGGDKELWNEAVKKFHALDEDDPNFDALQEEFEEARSNYINSIPENDIITEYGHDDAYVDYFNARNAQKIHDTLDAEVERLYGSYEELGYDKWNKAREELADRLGLPQFLDKAPSLGNAGLDEYIDLEELLPGREWWYDDPEALRYAVGRSMFEHPVLSPKDLMEVTGVDYEKVMGGVTPQKIAEKLYHSYFPNDFRVDESRLQPGIRQRLIDLMREDASKGWTRGSKWVDEFRDANYADTVELPLVRSYIGGRSGPFRVGARNKVEVKPQLKYTDVIKALPPEEYKDGGYVG